MPRNPTVVALACLLMLAGCTEGSGSGGSSSPGGSSGKTSGAWAAVTPSPGWTVSSVSGRPVVQTEAEYRGQPEHPIRLRIDVYPLQRLSDRLLLSIDFTPLSEGAGGLDFFVTAKDPTYGAMSGVSLVDPVRAVRYGVLKVPGLSSDRADEKDYYSSVMRSSTLEKGTWYRLGAFFDAPDPATKVLDVDLQRGGLLRNIPVTDDAIPLPGLVAGDQSAGASGSAAVSPSAHGGSLVTWPVLPPAADAPSQAHDLLGRVVGAKTASQGQGRGQGVVSVPSDILFDFDSDTLSASAAGTVAKVAGLVATQADPATPVRVVGHSDAKGTDEYNQRLSERRAAAVTAALRANGALSGLSLVPSGKGAKQPVAPNMLNGKDNPYGRALNRRVEVLFARKAAAGVVSQGASAGVTQATSTVTPAGTLSADQVGAATGTADDVTLPVVGVPGSGPGNQVRLGARVHPPVRAGRLTLVRFEATSPDEGGFITGGLSVFEGIDAGPDVSAFSLKDPATGLVYPLVADADSPTRVLGTWMDIGFNANRPYEFFFYTAALPDTASRVVVDLGPMGATPPMPLK